MILLQWILVSCGNLKQKRTGYWAGQLESELGNGLSEFRQRLSHDLATSCRTTRWVSSPPNFHRIAPRRNTNEVAILWQCLWRNVVQARTPPVRLVVLACRARDMECKFLEKKCPSPPHVRYLNCSLCHPNQKKPRCNRLTHTHTHNQPNSNTSTGSKDSNSDSNIPANLSNPACWAEAAIKENCQGLLQYHVRSNTCKSKGASPQQMHKHQLQQ
jgi:hypothetical protein